MNGEGGVGVVVSGVVGSEYTLELDPICGAKLICAISHSVRV